MKPIKALSTILKSPGRLSCEEIEVPVIPGDSVMVSMEACGICGSDVRYLHGENPWSQHTLGKNLPSPPNMVLGHEVAGTIMSDSGAKRVAILAYKGCAQCAACLRGDEHLCRDMMHFGHSAGWDDMDYYPGGMAESFTIWRDSAYLLPDTVSFEEAVFLDGLAVALHALETGGFRQGFKIAVLGLGPVGMLAGLAAKALGAESVVGCDIDKTAVSLGLESGLDIVVEGDGEALADTVSGGRGIMSDLVIDTVGTGATIESGLKMLDTMGSHVLLAVHNEKVPISPLLLNGERKILTSANNRYRDFPLAIQLLSESKVRVGHLITHRFLLCDVDQAFGVMENKEQEKAFKVVILPA